MTCYNNFKHINKQLKPLTLKRKNIFHKNEYTFQFFFFLLLKTHQATQIHNIH